MTLKDLIIRPKDGAIESLERAYDATAEIDEFGNTVFDARKIWQHLKSEGWDIRYDQLRTLRFGQFKVITGGKETED